MYFDLIEVLASKYKGEWNQLLFPNKSNWMPEKYLWGYKKKEIQWKKDNGLEPVKICNGNLLEDSGYRINTKTDGVGEVQIQVTQIHSNVNQ